jgi:hypothetical protein
MWLAWNRKILAEDSKPKAWQTPHIPQHGGSSMKRILVAANTSSIVASKQPAAAPINNAESLGRSDQCVEATPESSDWKALSSFPSPKSLRRTPTQTQRNQF